MENDQLYLLEIERLVDSYRNKIHAIGFSGHHKGLAADIAALTIGAEFLKDILLLIELGKELIIASLEPDGLRKLCRDLRVINKSLRRKNPPKQK